MATVTPGKHHSGEAEPTEAYGKHHATRAGGLTVAALIERVANAGQAIRLAWQGTDATGPAQTGDEFPTAELPVVREQDQNTAHSAEPPVVSRGGQRRTRPSGFSWWPRSLARI